MSARGCQLTRETTGPCRAAAAHSSTHDCAGQTPSEADGANALGLPETQTAAQAQPNPWCDQQDLDYGTPGRQPATAPHSLQGRKGAEMFCTH